MYKNTAATYLGGTGLQLRRVFGQYDIWCAVSDNNNNPWRCLVNETFKVFAAGVWGTRSFAYSQHRRGEGVARSHSSNT